MPALLVEEPQAIVTDDELEALLEELRQEVVQQPITCCNTNTPL